MEASVNCYQKRSISGALFPGFEVKCLIELVVTLKNAIFTHIRSSFFVGPDFCSVFTRIRQAQGIILLVNLVNLTTGIPFFLQFAVGSFNH